MALPGVYTQEEEEMIARWKTKSKKRTGWLYEDPKGEMAYPVFNRVATRELLKSKALLIDYWNPLWRDEKYARNTKWGDIIAPPYWIYCVTFGSQMAPTMERPGEEGAPMETIMGMPLEQTFEWLKPIRVNDSFRVFVLQATLEDVTKADNSGPRQFKVKSGINIFNQKDELIHLRRMTSLITIFPKMERPKTNPKPQYIYTKEELEFIKRLEDEEEIRGSNLRYWEEVKVGDELMPVVHGPLTAWDDLLAITGGGLDTLPMREVRRRTPGWTWTDPVTGIIHKTIEIHVSEYVAEGYTGAAPMPVGSELDLSRLITNWMGDDGFLKKLLPKGMMVMDIMGDTWIGKGEVIKKYINNGEHLVDLVVWIENIRGHVSSVFLATVSLPSHTDAPL